MGIFGTNVFCYTGDSSYSQEAFEPYKLGGVHQTSTVQLELNDYKYDVVSYTSSRGHGKSFVEYEITNADVSMPILTLAENVNWNIGTLYIKCKTYRYMCSFFIFIVYYILIIILMDYILKAIWWFF